MRRAGAYLRLSTLTTSSQSPLGSVSARQPWATRENFARSLAPPFPMKAAGFHRGPKSKVRSPPFPRGSRGLRVKTSLASLLLFCRQSRRSTVAVYLCCTCPRVSPGGRYPLSLPCGARTFLTHGLSPCTRGRLARCGVFYLQSARQVNKIIVFAAVSGYNQAVR